MALGAIAAVVVQFGWKLIIAAVLLAVGIKLSKWISKKILRTSRLSSVDDGVRKFISNTVRISLYILVVISAAGIMGIPYASFVAVLGSAGVAIGLALQGSLSNIASGILILVNKPFRAGDFIEANGISGTASEIGFFTTTIVTLDKKVVSVPNSVLSAGCITNYSAAGVRRVDIEIGADYGCDIDKVKEVLLAAAAADERVLKEPAAVSRLTSYGDSSLKFTLMAWCRPDDYWLVRFDLLENVKKALDEHNIEIPFNRLDVKLVNE